MKFFYQHLEFISDYLFSLLRPLTSITSGTVVYLPSPSNISYFWKFGSLLGVILGIQLITGVLLSFHYTGSSESSFILVDMLNRDVSYGWITRSIHAVGASSFFVCLYLHMFRGLYFYSFYNIKLWLSGTFILVLCMGAAFLGYVLPWGQMSYWGATVITNFISVIPFVGQSLVCWVWGGFSVKSPTISRFFGLHFLIPLVILVIVLLHVLFLHFDGSSNPLGIVRTNDKVEFFPFYSSKDSYGFFGGFLALYLIIFLTPLMFWEPQNFIEAKSLITPAHIQPEWYFLPAYAILRCIPNKLGGVLGLVFFLVIYFFLPFFTSNWFRGMNKKWYFRFLFWVFFANFLFLTYLGRCLVESPFLELSQVGLIIYFGYFFVVGALSFLYDFWLIFFLWRVLLLICIVSISDFLCLTKFYSVRIPIIIFLCCL